jgi:hypothetical protein
MKYLTVSADYRGTGIKDDFVGPVNPASLSLPTDLWKRVESWVGKYQPIIPMSPRERLLIQEQIEDLDSEGIAIARMIAEQSEDPVKVRYFSEGKLQFIPLPQ